MRILMASILNIGKDMNGVTVSIKELKSSLEKKGNQIKLASPYTYRKDSLLYKTLCHSAQWYQKFNYSFLSLVVLLIKMLIICVQVQRQKNNYNYFHAHDVFSAAVLLIAAGKNKVKILTTHFFTYPWEEFAEAGYVKYNSISFNILRYFSILVLRNKGLKKLSVSEYNYRNLQMIDSNSTNPKTVIYPGLKVKTQRIVLEDRANYLINVGTINHRKNQIVLIDILAELEKTGLQIPLVLVGPEDKTEKARIEQRIKELRIKSQVHFFGEQSEKQTRLLIANARLYIHTSFQESFGRTLIESINLHTPVLALDYKAVNEILTDDAVISREWSIARTAQYVKNFLTNKTLKERLQKRQYEHFLKNFTEEKMVEKYTNYILNPPELSMNNNNIFTLENKPIGSLKNERIHRLYKKYAQGGFWFARIKESLRSKIKVALWQSVLNLTLGIKRAIDIAGSLFFLILLSPLFLITAIAIMLEDGRPVFYTQIRVAKWGRLFKMYKFRSMFNNTDQMKDSLQSDGMTGSVIFKMKKDPRITRVGRIIRKLSIDEMPQFWNVLKGDLSLVGPRPPVPKEVKEYSLWDRKRLEVKPGLTCIWQVSGRSDIDFENQVKLDLNYIKRRSLKFDLLLLLKTIPAVIKGKGAY